MKITLFFRNKTKSFNVDPKYSVKQLKEIAADLFDLDISRVKLLHEGIPISSYVSDDTKLSDLAQAGGILSESPVLQVKVKKSKREIKRLDELFEKQNIELFELRQAKNLLESQMILNSVQMDRMYKILMLISKNFANQKVFDIETLVEDLKTRCQKMKHKIRGLKGTIQSFIMRILHQLDKHVPKEGLIRNEINEIKRDAEYAFELITKIRMLKKDENYEAAKKEKKIFLNIAGRHYKKIIDRICNFIHRTAKYEKIIDSSKMKKDFRDLNEMKQDKRALREQQKQIMLEFIKFLIKYQMMRNMKVEGCSGRRKKKKKKR
jgi:hypothetical protein